MNASIHPTSEGKSEPESTPTHGEVEPSREIPESVDDVEAIALDAVAALPKVQPHSVRDQGRIDVVGSDPGQDQASGGQVRHEIPTLPESTETQQDEPESEGQRIDEYSDSHRLEIRARIELFVRVCQAVHFAHQHTVIHGNLKPSNILVTADGVPKLLGSGVAQLADAGTVSGNDPTGTYAVSPETPTAPGGSSVTPAYASPEQLEGRTLTTASDIYALGVVLYQLLTGRSPYRLGPRNGADALSAVFEQVPEKPSSVVYRRASRLSNSPSKMKLLLPQPRLSECSWGPDLRSTSSQGVCTLQDIALARGCSPKRLKRILTGDLDAIVLLALRKEPERRYASAQHFADDLTRYLEGRPVRASGDSTIYRCGKLVRRHIAAVTIGLLSAMALLIVVTGLATGFIAAHLRETHAEKSLRQTREVVDQILTRASNDRLFNQPGFGALRGALLQDAQRFYKDFLDQHRSDSTLRAEHIEAIGCLAKIASLSGSTTEAVSQYRLAATLWEKLFTRQPANRHYQARLAGTLTELAVMLMPAENQLDEALRIFHRARELMEPLVAAEPRSVSKRQELGQIFLNVAQIQARQNDPDGALNSIDRALEIELQLVAENPGSLEPRITLASAYTTAGRILARQTGELDRALASYEEASAIYDAIVQEHPELADQAHQFARNLGELSELQQKAGQHDMAFQNLHRSQMIFERIDQLYPGILIYQKGLGSVYNMMSDLQHQRGEAAQSLVLAQKARTLFERLACEHPQDSDFRIELARSYNRIGRLFDRKGEIAEALRSFQRAVDLYESLPDLGSQYTYELACSISRCIPLLNTKNRSTPGSRATLELSSSDRLRRRLYGDRAMAALRRAVRTARFNAEKLETDTDLDALRDRADFHELIKDLEKEPVADRK